MFMMDGDYIPWYNNKVERKNIQPILISSPFYKGVLNNKRKKKWK